METVAEQKKFSEKEKTFSPADVRKLLNLENQDIQRLCKEVSVFPKKDNATGRIFFLRSDVEILRKVKELYARSQKVADKKQECRALVVSKDKMTPVSMDTNTIIDTVIGSQNNIIDRLKNVIEEKLDGIDDIVVELVKTKVENEKLRTKVDQLTKDNHLLIMDVNKFRPIGLGLYKKSKEDMFE